MITRSSCRWITHPTTGTKTSTTPKSIMATETIIRAMSRKPRLKSVESDVAAFTVWLDDQEEDRWDELYESMAPTFDPKGLAGALAAIGAVGAAEAPAAGAPYAPQNIAPSASAVPHFVQAVICRLLSSQLHYVNRSRQLFGSRLTTAWAGSA